MTDAIATINTAEVEREVAPVIAAADALVVRNVDEHAAGLALLARIMDARDRVKLFFKPSIEAAMESKRKAEATRQEVVAAQDHFLAPILTALDTASGTCKAFEAAERQAAAKVQEHLRAEALAKQNAQRELDAAMADTEDEAEDALTAPLAPPMVPVVRPEVAKVAGISTRETWAAEVTDKAAFLAWAAKPENNFYADANVVALNSRARAEKGAMRIPGVKAVSTLTHARR
jgi:hypothetical protein